MESKLLHHENSERTRTLIANTYFNQYFEMYPRFPDLLKMHEKKIRDMNVKIREVQGGKVFMFLCAFVGWKLAKRVQMLFYKFGYQP